MKTKVLTSVRNGNISRNRNMFLNVLRSFEGRDVEVTFERPSKRRSNSQNAYYWGVCLPIIQNGLYDATGEVRSCDAIHYNILLPLFAPIKETANRNTGLIITERLTSSALTTTQFAEFIMSVQQWAAEYLGVNIPDPNEQLTIL